MHGLSLADTRFAGGPVELVVRREVLDLRRADSFEWVVVANGPLRKAGGGQPADAGMLSHADGRMARVRDVRRRPDATEIAVEDPAPFGIGEHITIAVDAARRFRLSRAHTLTHVLMACLAKAASGFGSRGAEIDEAGRIVTLHLEARDLTRRQIDQALDDAREKISDDLKVSVHHVRGLEVARAIPRFRIDKSLDLKDRIRLIEVAGLDVNPCSGTHLASLRPIGTGFYLECHDRRDGIDLLRVRLPDMEEGGP